MNRRMICYTVGRIMMLTGILLLLPLGVAACYGEWKGVLSFAVSAAASAAVGLALCVFLKPTNKVIYAKEGFSIASLVWLVVSIVGAMPFVISGEIPNLADAFFESASGFTTTGATIVTDLESMSHGILFWRSFTHWIGGMGVLVLMMAILPGDSGRAIHIMKAEMAGPVVGKLVPKIKDTAKLLYIIYLVMTIAEMLCLLVGGLSLYESAIYALGTAGTGGFGIKGDSLTSYSPYVQWVITAFMILFGVNFNLYYFLLIKRFKDVLRNFELWFYFGLLIVSAAVISFSIYPLYNDVGDTIRTALFQTSSLVSTTGFSTADFNLWPSLAKGVLFLLLFVGGCAGSTAGGLKISRVILLFKLIKRDLSGVLHPHSVKAVKVDGKAVDSVTLQRVGVYFSVYIMIIAAGFLLISFEPFDFETNLTASITCVNNVGPGFGAVGPMGGFSGYSDFSTIVLAFEMILGRLEIYPILVMLDPSIWITKRKKAAVKA